MNLNNQSITIRPLSEKIQLFFVKSLDILVDPIAIRPQIHLSKNGKKRFISWQTPGKEVRFSFSDIQIDSEKVVSIKANTGSVYQLIPLNLDVYNSQIKEQVSGHPKFSSTNELCQYYLTTNFWTL